MSSSYMMGGTLPPPVAPMGLGHIDPALNNQPLRFNHNQGKPLVMLDVDSSSDGDMRDNGDRNTHQGQLPELEHENHDKGPMPPTGPEQGPMGLPMGGWGPPMIGPMQPMGDPMMMSMGYAPFPAGYMGGPMPLGQDGNPMVPPKEVMTFKACTLFPPPPNAPPPSLRERPPGCRTVFIGGLPENVTEEMLKEVFENCGAVTSIRISKKNFAHIRFDFEDSVDRAIYLSGYRMTVESKDEKPVSGRLHVDFAQARDDLYEWECKQRVYAREERHRVRVEVDRLRPPSPPPITHYSDHEATLLIDRLKSEDGFVQSAEVLVTWIDRGDCNRRTANTFYSLIQSTNAHIRRLLTDKAQHDGEFEQVKLKFRQQIEIIIRQFELIEKVFTTASKQKAWDHFSKAQRKNIDLWRKQAQAIALSQKADFLKDRDEAEMEMSDSEDGTGSSEVIPAKRKREPVAESSISAQDWANLSQMRIENEALQVQLEAYKNEMELLKQESRHVQGGNQDKQLTALQQALQGMQKQLINAQTDLKTSEEEVRSLKLQLSIAEKQKLDKDVAASDKDKPVVVIDKEDDKVSVSDEDGDKVEVMTVEPKSATSVDDKEARLIALLSTFLHVHPFGASVDYIWAYLHRLGVKIRTSELEDLMEKFPGLFHSELYGVGVALEKRWKFTGFEKEGI